MHNCHDDHVWRVSQRFWLTILEDPLWLRVGTIQFNTTWGSHLMSRGVLHTVRLDTLHDAHRLQDQFHLKQAWNKRIFKRQQPPILINSWKISPTWKHFKASTHRKSAKFDHIASLEVASFKYHPLCCNEWIPSQQFQVTNPTGANINLTNCSQITGKCPSSKQTRRFFRPKGLDQVDSSWLWFLQYLWLTRCLKHPMLLSRQAWPCR